MYALIPEPSIGEVLNFETKKKKEKKERKKKKKEEE